MKLLRALDQIRATGTPVAVLSGGEPLMRDDLCTIARYGTDLGLRIVMGTSGYFLDRPMAENLKEAGIRAVAISLDSADPIIHDSFRGVSGAWERAIQAIRNCTDAGIGVQINMTAMRPGAGDIESVVALGKSLGVVDYQVFIPHTDRKGRKNRAGKSPEYEEVIRQVLITYRDSDINLRPTCAPQFRRIAADLGIEKQQWGRGCIAGISYCRIYANGDVTPCPYLPVSAGNVREIPFDRIWNESPIFVALRNWVGLPGNAGGANTRPSAAGAGPGPTGGRRNSRPAGATVSKNQQQSWVSSVAEDPWCPYEPGGST